MLVIGSQALIRAGLGVTRSYEPDLDVICSEATMWEFCDYHKFTPVKLADYKWQVSGAPQFNHIEFELLEHSKSGIEYNLYLHGKNVEWLDIYGVLHPIAPIEVLHSIKRSHRHYPRQWSKHIGDYLILRDALFLHATSGSQFLEDITKIREQETKERYGALKTPSLDKSAKDFFDDSVSNRVFIHDEIHQIMAHREKPMYEYIKLGTDSVKCSKQKFLDMSYVHRIQCVLEEAYVIALERAIIPMLYSGGKLATGESAIEWALMRICTTLTSGWFRDFSTENYREIKAAHDKCYVHKFLTVVESGRIKRI